MGADSIVRLWRSVRRPVDPDRYGEGRPRYPPSGVSGSICGSRASSEISTHVLPSQSGPSRHLLSPSCDSQLWSNPANACHCHLRSSPIDSSPRASPPLPRLCLGSPRSRLGCADPFLASTTASPSTPPTPSPPCVCSRTSRNGHRTRAVWRRRNSARRGRRISTS